MSPSFGFTKRRVALSFKPETGLGRGLRDRSRSVVRSCSSSTVYSM